MQRYIAQRLLLAIPTLLGVAIFLFVLMRVLPYSAIDISTAESSATPEVKAKLKAAYGLNDPMPVQFLRYMGQVVRGDLGKSIVSDRPVWSELRNRLPVTAERASLNFLQTLSGTATATAAYVDAVSGTGTQILDTRKTIPGLRMAQKYAVRVGGGMNHRMGLFDAMMLKENHIRAFGSVAGAIGRARTLRPDLPLIVEVETLDQLREALATGCTRVLIDDFDADSRREAVRIAHAAPFNGAIPLEVSGGVDLKTVRSIAADGVDCISIGGLTKHVHAIDFSLKLGEPPADLSLA